MAEVDGGCIFLARKILESEIWSDKPAWWLKVWLYLLVRVNHTDKGKIKRGQGFFRLAEIRENCQLFDVKVKSIHHVITWLKLTTQIVTQKTTRGMIITICNYDEYQNITNYKSDTERDTEREKQGKCKGNGSDTICKNEIIKNVKDIVPPEKKSAKEKDIPPFAEIINYLNKQAGKKFTSSRPQTREHINARWSEGRKLDDFKKVIDIKVAEWLNDPKMYKHLCPDTLFGTKFEKYWNQRTTIIASEDVEAKKIRINNEELKKKMEERRENGQ